MPQFDSAAIASEAQKLAGDRLVKLYELDCTSLGGQIFRFVSSVDASVAIISITPSGATNTVVTMTPHLLQTGDPIRISGTDFPDYNIDSEAVVSDAYTFTYDVSGTLETSITGAAMFVHRLNNTMWFDGLEYRPAAVDVDGFEWNGQGSLPTPRVKISNVNKILMASVITLKDLVGAKFTRQRTFRKFMDDGSDPDPTAIFPKEIYKVNRKSVQNKVFIEFELASSFDQQNAKIPGRVCLKTSCDHRYRKYDSVTHTFDYTNATCPYAGTAYFNEKNQATADPAADRCGKQLSSCKKRFGTAPLPTRAFPGVGR